MGAYLSVVLQSGSPLHQVCCAHWRYFSVQKHPELGGLSTLQMGDGALQVGHDFQHWKGFNWAQTLF